MQSSYSRGFPSTPSRGLQASQSGSQATETSSSTINNNALESRYTPRRKSTLTPSRYIPPSPLPGLSQSGSQSSQGAGQSVFSSISFQDPKYRALADNAELRAVIEQTQNNVDAAIKAIKHGKSERRRAHEAVKVEMLEEDRRWETECERLRKEGADVVKGKPKFFYTLIVLTDPHSICSPRTRKRRNSGRHSQVDTAREPEESICSSARCITRRARGMVNKDTDHKRG